MVIIVKIERIIQWITIELNSHSLTFYPPILDISSISLTKIQHCCVECNHWGGLLYLPWSSQSATESSICLNMASWNIECYNNLTSIQVDIIMLHLFMKVIAP